jgi:hypothetical protein
VKPSDLEMRAALDVSLGASYSLLVFLGGVWFALAVWP